MIFGIHRKRRQFRLVQKRLSPTHPICGFPDGWTGQRMVLQVSLDGIGNSGHPLFLIDEIVADTHVDAGFQRLLQSLHLEADG